MVGGFVVSPVQAMGEEVLSFRMQRFTGPPERHDVIVNLILRRDFDQVDRALAPVANRLDPEARPLLKVRFEILVCREVALPLQQSEAAWVDIGKDAHLQVIRIRQRAPDDLSTSITNGQSIRVVDGRPEVINANPIIGIEEEHAGERSNSSFWEINPRIK